MANAIAVRAKCSECDYVQEINKLTPEQKDIVCPACSRRMQNLTAEEFGEIEAVQKKQLVCSILSIVFFVLAAVCVVLWVGGGQTWVSTNDQPGPDATATFFFGAIVCAIASLTLGILASLKRFVLEF